jgi:hypothetical protein
MQSYVKVFPGGDDEVLYINSVFEINDDTGPIGPIDILFNESDFSSLYMVLVYIANNVGGAGGASWSGTLTWTQNGNVQTQSFNGNYATNGLQIATTMPIMVDSGAVATFTFTGPGFGLKSGVSIGYIKLASQQ